MIAFNFKIFISYLKKYWQYFVVVLLVFIGYFIFNHKNNISIKELIEKINNTHRSELDDIKNSYEKEIKEKEKNIKKLEETISIIEKKYNEAQKQLDEAKKQEIKKIIEETKGDPNELAKRLQESTGFKIF